MSKTNLEDRQAALGRPDDFVTGSFADDGREVIKKSYKSGQAAEKPRFFLGGSDPTVPTGPKRKLRSSWLADGPIVNKEEPPPRRSPTKKWTPIGGKKLPGRCKSHDGTMSTSSAGGVRKGRKPFKPGNKKADEEKETEKEVEDEEKDTGEPKPEEEEATATEAGEEEASVSEEAPAKEEEKMPAKEEVKKAETGTKIEEGWQPAAIAIRKPVRPTEEDRKRQASPPPAEKTAPTPAVSTNGECGACAQKDALLQEQAAEIELLKAERGDLAKAVKKTKGSQVVNTELKEQVYELQHELTKKNRQDANSKAFGKLESKLNTLKMVTDGKVNKNDLAELKEHVNMIHMVLNQDLKKEGMKNVWA